MQPGLRNKQATFFLGLTLLAAVWTNVWTEHRFGDVFPKIYSVTYLPRGQMLDFLSIGFRETMADIIYLWAIQFYGSMENPLRAKYIHKIFELIAELDPLFVDAYRLGALICFFEEHRLEDCAIPILDLGLKNNPNSWEISVDAGYYYWLTAHQLVAYASTTLSADIPLTSTTDDIFTLSRLRASPSGTSPELYARLRKRYLDRAYNYFMHASRVPHAPLWTRSWLARLRGEAGNIREALAVWRAIYRTARKDSLTWKVARSHIHDLQLWLQAQEIQKWWTQFVRTMGRSPASLEELRNIGYTGPLRDPYGRPFRYNPVFNRIEPHPESLIFSGTVSRPYIW